MKLKKRIKRIYGIVFKAFIFFGGIAVTPAPPDRGLVLLTGLLMPLTILTYICTQYNFTLGWIQNVPIGVSYLYATLFISNMVQELYGKGENRFVICLALLSILLIIVFHYDSTPRFIFVFLIAWIVAQYVAFILYDKFRRVTTGRLLWLRSIFSLFIGQYLFILIYLLLIGPYNKDLISIHGSCLVILCTLTIVGLPLYYATLLFMVGKRSLPYAKPRKGGIVHGVPDIEDML